MAVSASVEFPGEAGAESHLLHFTEPWPRSLRAKPTHLKSEWDL